MRRGVEPLRQAGVERHLHEACDGPNEQDEPKAGPRHPTRDAGRGRPRDPSRRRQFRRHGWGYDPRDAPHVRGLERLVVACPHVLEERVVDKLHHEDDPEHQQGRNGVE